MKQREKRQGGKPGPRSDRQGLAESCNNATLNWDRPGYLSIELSREYQTPYTFLTGLLYVHIYILLVRTGVSTMPRVCVYCTTEYTTAVITLLHIITSSHHDITPCWSLNRLRLRPSKNFLPRCKNVSKRVRHPIYHQS